MLRNAIEYRHIHFHISWSFHFLHNTLLLAEWALSGFQQNQMRLPSGTCLTFPRVHEEKRRNVAIYGESEEKKRREKRKEERKRMWEEIEQAVGLVGVVPSSLSRASGTSWGRQWPLYWTAKQNYVSLLFQVCKDLGVYCPLNAHSRPRLGDPETIIYAVLVHVSYGKWAWQKPSTNPSKDKCCPSFENCISAMPQKGPPNWFREWGQYERSSPPPTSIIKTKILCRPQ